MQIEIQGRPIGPGHPCYVIVELSCNHEGSLREAERLVDAAAECGADAVKLQTYTPDTMTRDFQYRPAGTMWEEIDLYSLYQKAYTPWEWHAPLRERSLQAGLHFFSSPFDETAVDFLVELGVPALKIASFEVVDTKLLQKAAATGLPVLMSSGMTTYLELTEAVRTLRDEGCQQLALFQCNSGYPSSFDDANLATIPVMSRLFNVPVGLSDHILFAQAEDMSTPVAHVSPVEAVKHGACMIEVHLTLDREKARQSHGKGEGGFDWAFSREPHELKRFIRLIRELEGSGGLEYDTELERDCAGRAKGRATFEPTAKELSSRRLRPSLWVTRAVKRGELFRFCEGKHEGNFDSLRPGGGLEIRFTDYVNGNRATRDLDAGTPLEWAMLELPAP